MQRLKFLFRNFATFKQFLEKENVNSNDVFKIIKELIVKTMISVQVANQNGMRSLANP